MTDTLATYANANNLAATLNDLDGRDYVVIKTGDPIQPYKVEPANGQANIAVLVTTGEVHATTWTAKRRQPSEHGF